MLAEKQESQQSSESAHRERGTSILPEESRGSAKAASQLRSQSVG